MRREDCSRAEPRRHRLPPLPRHPEASNGLCAGIDRPQPHPQLHFTRPPTTSGAPSAHRRQSDSSQLRPAGRGNAVGRAAAELRHTGMKPMLSRRPPAPFTNSSRAMARSSEFAPGAADAAATVATLNCGAALDEQPPVAAERASSTSSPLSLPYAQPATAAGVTPLFNPHPPPSSPSPAEEGLPGRYRTTAMQFIKAIERLNRMTSTTCSADATSFFALTEERTASGKVGVRKMARVPLLPLTLCTDGATVILVDPNGTERHGNYLKAVDGFHQYSAAFTSAASSHGSAAPSVSPHPPSNVLWWALSDLQQTPCAVPLTTARASLSVERLISGNDSVNKDQSFTQPRPAHAPGRETSPTMGPAKTTATFAAIQPCRLTLRYGEPLALVFASAGARVGAEAAADVPPWSTANESTGQREGSPHIGYNLLRDVYHGYLPSFLEFLYPNGGIMLRGCWCAVSTSAADEPMAPSVKPFSQQQQQVSRATVSLRDGGGGAAPRSSSRSPTSRGEQGLLVTTVPMPLLGWSPQSTGPVPIARRDNDAGAVDEETFMPSFRPTAVPPPRRSPATNTVVDLGAATCKRTTLPDAVLQLPPAVLRFLAQDGGRTSVASAIIPGGPRAYLSSSPPPPSQPTTTAAAPSLRLTLRRVESHSEPDVCATDFGADESASAAYDFDSYRVHAGGDCRGIHDSNLQGSQLQQQWQARNGFGLVYVSALLHTPSQPPPPMGMAGKPSVACESVMVLTPAGHVELVVPATSHAAARPITITDVQYSLLRSAVGCSLHLRDEEVAFTYAPGTPDLHGATVVDAAHVVLRLRRRASRAHLEAARQQVQGVGKR
ncbi:hypothetical protein conserved [Leishmania donovani]|uniref:Hypothetical_protein_conserved n=1 Tax=Leishmania donovani TaxID=5661 RepID=A0A6J8FAN6_LEIDO|nr:hypothetical protein conserved [Leishmania donovani]VDZ43900.1 hypothetical_protein_conserved [Leishmania donovani]